MGKTTTYVGMDTHRRKIAVAILAPEAREADRWEIPNEPGSVQRLIRKLQKMSPVQCCYEAGPLGYTLKRELDAAGIPCMVVAPSLIPLRHGDRIKTDHRDARKLADLLRAGLLTEVHPPSEDEEAVRDLCRCREDAQQDLTRARHRLSKFLLRRGLSFSDGYSWSQAYRSWIGNLKFDRDADRFVFEDYLLAMEQQEARVAALDQRLEEICKQKRYAEPVGALKCFRGIDTLTALTVVAELHDFRRFRLLLD